MVPLIMKMTVPGLVLSSLNFNPAPMVAAAFAQCITGVFEGTARATVSDGD